MRLCNTFPIEVWEIIIRHAITQPWADDIFIPPKDMAKQSGVLRRTCSFFGPIVDAITSELLIVDSIWNATRLTDEEAALVR